jgi:hypothetical protein
MENNFVVASDLSSFRKGNYFPIGSTCSFSGKDLPCLSLCSLSEGTKADLIGSILKKIDNKNIFFQEHNCPKPLLIVDGHESQLDSPFLELLNAENRKWFV